MKRSLCSTFFFGAWMLLPLSSASAQCALCRQALASGGNEGLLRGFYLSILLMTGVPLILLSVAGWMILRSLRLKRPLVSR